MTALGINYMLRDDSVALYGFLSATHYTLEELNRIAAGKLQRYNHSSMKKFAVTRFEQVALSVNSIMASLY